MIAESAELAGILLHAGLLAELCRPVPLAAGVSRLYQNVERCILEGRYTPLQ